MHRNLCWSQLSTTFIWYSKIPWAAGHLFTQPTPCPQLATNSLNAQLKSLSSLSFPSSLTLTTLPSARQQMFNKPLLIEIDQNSGTQHSDCINQGSERLKGSQGIVSCESHTVDMTLEAWGERLINWEWDPYLRKTNTWTVLRNHPWSDMVLQEVVL